MKNSTKKESLIENDFYYTVFSELVYEQGDYRKYQVRPEYGEGIMILYKVVDGLYIMHSNYSFKQIDFQIEKVDCSNVILIYQIEKGGFLLHLKNHKASCLKTNDIVNFAGDGEVMDATPYKNQFVITGLYGDYNLLRQSLKKYHMDVELLDNYYRETKKNKEVVSYTGNIKFKALIKEISDLLIKENHFLLKPKALELLYYGLTGYNIENKIIKPKYANDYIEKVFEIKKFIDEEPLNRLSIEEMAMQFGINATYFKSIFKECFDIQPHRYRLKRRLVLAESMLKNKNNKICYIANSLGFSSSSKFSEAFKIEYGYLPSEYRKSINRS